MSRGFSLVECVVASVLCAGGVMALAAGSRASLDLMVLGERTGGAATVAAARLATLRGSACGAPSEGQVLTGVFHEHWSVTATARASQVRVDVTFDHGGRAHTQSWQVVLVCPAA